MGQRQAHERDPRAPHGEGRALGLREFRRALAGKKNGAELCRGAELHSRSRGQGEAGRRERAERAGSFCQRDRRQIEAKRLGYRLLRGEVEKEEIFRFPGGAETVLSRPRGGERTVRGRGPTLRCGLLAGRGRRHMASGRAFLRNSRRKRRAARLLLP